MTRKEAIKFAVHAQSLADLPEVKEFYAFAESALREQEERDNRLESDAVKNEPMTLDELIGMPLKEWVWVEVLQKRSGLRDESAYYRKLLGWMPETTFFCGYTGWTTAFDYADYGKTWLAYRSKPREDAK